MNNELFPHSSSPSHTPPSIPSSPSPLSPSLPCFNRLPTSFATVLQQAVWQGLTALLHSADGWMPRTEHTGCIVLLMRPYILVTWEPACATVCVRLWWRGHVRVPATWTFNAPYCVHSCILAGAFASRWGWHSGVEIFINARRDNALNDKQDGSQSDRYYAEIDLLLAKADLSPSPPLTLHHSHCKALNLWPLSTRCACQKSLQNNSSCPA